MSESESVPTIDNYEAPNENFWLKPQTYILLLIVVLIVLGILCWIKKSRESKKEKADQENQLTEPKTDQDNA